MLHVLPQTGNACLHAWRRAFMAAFMAAARTMTSPPGRYSISRYRWSSSCSQQVPADPRQWVAA